MANPDQPMLFLPPQPPLALLPGMSVVIGRSRSCDLKLPTGDSSRRHAEISDTPDGFVLRDLASTNGTYVNDTRVTEHVLHQGDRIQIGSNEITFCRIGVEPESFANTEQHTILMERPGTQRAFDGDLAEVPPYAVFQVIEMAGKSGRLTIDYEGGEGTLWFDAGRPIAAETKHQAGFEAALAIAQAERGRFSFEPMSETPEPTITATVTELLLEASRLLDEADR